MQTSTQFKSGKQKYQSRYTFNVLVKLHMLENLLDCSSNLHEYYLYIKDT
jgi:hypothetical protein